MITEDNWFSTDKRLPESNQTVEARSRFESKIYTVTFQGHPAPRWEHQNVAYQFERFAWWRPITQRSGSLVPATNP